MEEEPIQVKEAERVGYIPKRLPFTASPVASTVYLYKGEWWLADWFGVWFIIEYDPNHHGGPICDSEEEAMNLAEKLI